MKQIISKINLNSNIIVERSNIILMFFLLVSIALTGYATVINKLSFIEFVTCGIFLTLLTISINVFQILYHLKNNTENK
jgi:hypothetical protein